MAAIPGLKGGLYTGATPTKLARVTEATLSIEQETIDVTSFDSNGWQENIPGIKSWSVDGEGLFDPSETTQEDLYDALVNGESLSTELYPQDQASAKGYKGTAIVTSFEIGVPVDDGVTFSFSLTGTGPLQSATKTP